MNYHFYFAEIHIIKGFSMISYAHNIRKAFASATINDFKFEEKPVQISIGVNDSKILSYSEWQKECRDHVQKYYTSRGKFFEVILLPDLMKQDESLWSGVINTEIIKSWCGMSNNKLALIFPGYNILNHFNVYGITHSVLQEALGIKYFPTNLRRLLVFDASRRVILIIRVASDDSLKDEINHCLADVKLLSLMLRDELRGSGVVVTGLLVYLGCNIHLAKPCQHCRDLIVSKEIFDSKENIDEFWKSHEDDIHKHVEKKLLFENKSKLFMDVCCKLLPYLAQYQYQVADNPILPVNRADPAKNIEETMLLLDRYQMEIVYSKEKRVILKGDYGTGKSIICLKKIEVLSRTLKEKEAIYYINFHGKSELDYLVKQKIEVLHPNISILKGNSTLSNIIKFEILEKEEMNDTNDVHLIVDEYNAESLTKVESSTLKMLFTEKKQLKNSSILMAVQPIQIERADLHCINGEENEYSEAGNIFGELEKIMAVKHLHLVMRTTVEIDSFIKITQEYLNKKSNKYTRNLENNDLLVELSSIKKTDLNRQDRTDKDKSLTELENIEINRNRNLETDVAVDKPVEMNICKETTLKYGSTQINLKSEISSNYLAKKVSLISNSIDFDELQKLTHTGGKKNSENYQKRVTSYQYFYQSTIGHNISGSKPNLIKILSSTSPNELATMIAIFFKIIEEGIQRAVLIHFEQENPLWLEKLLQLPNTFPHLSITSDTRYFLSTTNEKLLLVKNYNCVKGLEFSDVIILLDANEYHLKQFIPEAMARCQSNLSILITASKDEVLENDTVVSLLEYWEMVNLELGEENPIAKTLQLQFCSCISNVLCEIKAERGNGYCHLLSESDIVACYEVHKNCSFYKNMSKEIQYQVVPYMTPNDIQRRHDAINL